MMTGTTSFVEVVKGLWDGWEDGALLFDKGRGQYFDETKMQVLGHRGRFLKVRGPLSVAGMPHCHPVIVQAGDSEHGHELGARPPTSCTRSTPHWMARAATTPM
jgi:alkanesulfonate monooxygenase SsuD/methylene tetrahydromethanopterin reductase-like flavin-dependent oxidoreductase (luciferase family)